MMNSLSGSSRSVIVVTSGPTKREKKPRFIVPKIVSFGERRGERIIRSTLQTGGAW